MQTIRVNGRRPGFCGYVKRGVNLLAHRVNSLRNMQIVKIRALAVGILELWKGRPSLELPARSNLFILFCHRPAGILNFDGLRVAGRVDA